MEDLNIFSIDLAQKYGLEQAVLINFLTKVIGGINTHNKKIISGKVWIHLTLHEIESNLPFFSEARIGQLLTSLIYHEVLARRIIAELGCGYSYSFR